MSGHETIFYEMQPQDGLDGLQFTNKSQFMHAIQDRNYGTRANKAHEDTIAYRRQTPQGHSRHDVAANDLVRGIGSKDISSSRSYARSYYPQPQAAYDPYGYRYNTSAASSSNGYYPIQLGETSLFMLNFNHHILVWNLTNFKNIYISSSQFKTKPSPILAHSFSFPIYMHIQLKYGHICNGKIK